MGTICIEHFAINKPPLSDSPLSFLLCLQKLDIPLRIYRAFTVVDLNSSEINMICGGALLQNTIVYEMNGIIHIISFYLDLP